ncbi:MAG: hypothetical protein WDW38_007322 [Sanguina aurantia]
METDGQEIPAGNFIKVSAGSNVKAVAGKIAHSCREGNPPAALCIGAACINQAVKAVCIARGYLTQDGMDLSLQPAFRDTDRSRASLALYLAKQAIAAPPSNGEESVELSVGAHSKPAVVAGALAARVREGKNVSMTAIGVDAVSNAVLAIGNARLYLEQDHLDIRVQPMFVQVQKEDRELNAVRFQVSVEQI